MAESPRPAAAPRRRIPSARSFVAPALLTATVALAVAASPAVAGARAGVPAGVSAGVSAGVPAATRSAASSPAVALTNDDRDREVTVPKNGRFTVTLSAASGTGYSWYYLDGTAPWKLVSRSTITTKGGLPGAPVREQFTFRATASGTAYLRIISARPFDPAIDPANVWQVHVTVG